MPHTGSCLLQAVAALLLASASLAAGEQNAFVGCFPVKAVSWFAKRIELNAVNGTIRHACDLHCGKRKYPLFAIGPQATCACGVTIPHHHLSVFDRECYKGSVLKQNVRMYYRHHVANSACHLKPGIIDSTTWEPQYNPQFVYFDTVTAGGRLDVYMEGDKGGSRVIAGDAHTYGLYSFMGVIDTTPGSVTAFYLSDDRPNNHTSQDEIDFEFINAFPSGNATHPIPGSIWTHTYVDGESQPETMITTQDVRNLTGNTLFEVNRTNGNLYTIDWDPEYIRWYVNGVFVDERVRGPNFTIPRKPSYMMVTMWTSQFEGQFGGWGGHVNPNAGDLQSSFWDIRRVLCRVRDRGSDEKQLPPNESAFRSVAVKRKLRD